MTATADLSERRSLFDDDHEEFRASVREFLTCRVVGHVDAWEKQGAGFAHAVAAVGAHLVLAARRTDRLGKLAAELAGAGTRVVTHTAEAAVTAPAGSWRSGDGTVRNLAVQDALADEAGPGADR